MNEYQSTPEGEKVIQVEAPNPAGETRSLVTSLALFALIVGIISFAGGFGIGKINLSASSSQTLSSASPSAKIEGGGVYVDKENLYAISYPKKWEAQKHESGDYAGVKITSSKGTVDLWLLVDQPFLLGEKHQSAIESEGEISVNINGKDVKGTKFNYKAGNFFIILVLPDTANSPQVTFWLEADDEETNEEVIKTVQSFEFLNK